MGDVISVVVTGAGAPGIAGTIYSLKNNPDDMEFRIISTDVKSDPVGRYLADEFYNVPPPEDKEYIHSIKEIVLKENAKVIIPQTTREIISLSQHLDEFREIDVSVIVSDYSSLKRANDKYLVIKECEKIKVPYPEYFLIDNENDFLSALDKLGYPDNNVVVKPRLSSGLRGLRIISNETLTIKEFLEEKPTGLNIDLESILRIFRNGPFPEILVTEYLPGDEYSVDVFRNSNGIAAIPRNRKDIRSGISFDTEIELRDDIIKYSTKLAESLDLKYCFGFQFKISNTNVPKILESNPRIQGTMVASTYAGFNMIYYSVKEALGYNIEISDIEICDNTHIKRYWGAIAIKDANYFGKI
ncbi:MAG: ATP-grasp domain-containing protein [Candidatus Brocadiales bacterium]|nr:ATP-grasp domain-containing protein [Candidatus Brocadiales bacterium]